MSNPKSLTRSPELMNRDDSALLVVDVQAKLLPLIPEAAHAWSGTSAGSLMGPKSSAFPSSRPSNIRRVWGRRHRSWPPGSEPSPASSPSVAASAATCLPTGSREGIWKILVCGIETHVCVGQTVHDLLGEGFRVFVAADAVAARGAIDHEIALRRMDSSGATLTTTEAALFEWCERSGSPEFKQIAAHPGAPGMSVAEAACLGRFVHDAGSVGNG